MKESQLQQTVEQSTIAFDEKSESTADCIRIGKTRECPSRCKRE